MSKYVFKRIRNGKEQIFARVAYIDNGSRKYQYKIAKSEAEAAQMAQEMILESKLFEIFNERNFEKFKIKVLSLYEK